MNLFFTESGENSREPAEFVLEGQEAVHAVRVLRIRPGDTLNATDGKGRIYRGRVISASGNLVRAEVEETVAHPRPEPLISIAVGNLRKRDRMEFAVEKAVEMGVRELLVFNGDHSEKRNVRLDRMESTALGAMKQSLRPWLPEVREFRDLESLLSEAGATRIVVADETKQETSLDLQGWRGEKKLLFVVAPEGGFSQQERELLARRKAETISLGPYRLRTETAVVAVASLFIPGRINPAGQG